MSSSGSTYPAAKIYFLSAPPDFNDLTNDTPFPTLSVLIPVHVNVLAFS